MSPLNRLAIRVCDKPRAALSVIGLALALCAVFAFVAGRGCAGPEPLAPTFAHDDRQRRAQADSAEAARAHAAEVDRLRAERDASDRETARMAAAYAGLARAALASGARGAAEAAGGVRYVPAPDVSADTPGSESYLTPLASWFDAAGTYRAARLRQRPDSVRAALLAEPRTVLVSEAATREAAAAWAETATLRPALARCASGAASLASRARAATVASHDAALALRMERSASRAALTACDGRAALLRDALTAERSARGREPWRLALGPSYSARGPGLAVGLSGTLPLPLVADARVSVLGTSPLAEPAPTVSVLVSF